MLEILLNTTDIRNLGAWKYSCRYSRRYIPSPSEAIQHLSNSFRFKDQISFARHSHVVNKFKCQWCQPLYIGETFHHLTTRVSEHLGVLAYTEDPLT